MKWTLQACIFFLALSSSVAQENCTYEVGYSYNRNVSLVGLHFVGDYTLLALEVDGGKSGFPIFLHPKDNYRPMELITYNQTYPLRDAKGIAFFPLLTNVMPGEKKRFLLYFDRLPAEVTTFDLIEPEVPLESGFNFEEIRIIRRKSAEASCRFFLDQDFIDYFSGDKMDIHEGFWALTLNWKARNGKTSTFRDTVAFVYEDGLLRFYDRKGFFQNLEWKPEENLIRFRFGFLNLPFRPLVQRKEGFELQSYKLNGKNRRKSGLKYKEVSIFFQKLE